MRKPISSICYFFIIFLVTFADRPQASSTTSSEKHFLVSELDAYVATIPPETVTAIIASDAKSGHVIYEKNSRLNLVPASVLKIITATIAFETLGSQFRYLTRIASRQPVNKKGVLNGGLVIVFNGDPSLKREHIETMLSSMKRRGINDIHGTIWLDGSIFSGYPNADGVSWNNLKICFGAPSSAMNLDRNCFYAHLHPNKTVGKNAVISYAQPQWPMTLENLVMTAEPSLAAKCPPTSWPSTKSAYRLAGCVPVDDQPFRLAFAVKNPESAMQHFIISALKRQRIKHHGQVIIGKPSVKLDQNLEEHYSAPLSELLVTMLEKSDNLYADSILKTLGYQRGGTKGSYETGIAVLNNTLRQNGIDLRRSNIEDGSGLSRDNLISAVMLNDILLFGWQKWHQQLPWLAHNHQKSRWMKTGTMKGIRSIAGYVFSNSNAPVAVTILLNGVAAETKNAEVETKLFINNIRRLQHKLIDNIAKSMNKE